MQNFNPHEIIITKNKSDIIKTLLTIWQNTLKEKKGQISIALSGGSSPLPFYKELAKNTHKINWKRVNIFFTDERFVPETQAENNANTIKHILLNKIPIPTKNIYYIDTSLNINVSINSYVEKIKNIVPTKNNIPCFDLTMLGIGEDGHTASLFSHNKKWQTTKKLVIQTKKIGEPFQRVSLTPYIINNSKKIIFIVTGKNKTSIAQKIINSDPNYPASYIKSNNSKLKFLL